MAARSHTKRRLLCNWPPGCRVRLPAFGAALRPRRSPAARPCPRAAGLLGWLPLSLALVQLSPPGAPAPRAALAQRRPPQRPSGALAGWRALAPCAGGPPGVFRRLRAPGAGSGTALTRAALARDNSGN